ncbi:MAG: cupin domain-containing protein [Planctomycetota bacterium]
MSFVKRCIILIAKDNKRKRRKKMPTVKDVIVRKPTDEEKETVQGWPIWQCEASTFDWSYTEKETCLLLEGEVTVSDGTDSVSFGPGDMVIFPVDLECTWNVKQAVKKHYTFG